MGMTQFEALVMGIIAGALLHSKDVVIPELKRERLDPDVPLLIATVGSQKVRITVEEVKE
jgi:hypothetical protein